MNTEPCPWESELLSALGRGFTGGELDAHIDGCPSCIELRLVAGALLDDRAVAMGEAPVPAAGTMWWRMRVRQRREAETSARRPLLIGQAVTLLIAIALVITFFGTDLATGVRDLVATLRLSTPLLLAVTTWLLLAPIAGWVALREK
ncbi:MAG TPA: hypothetical protein VM534_07290 [Thermoanaerobaculia bacterium]|nr:hypothetical protein [Thermoanaerobaculia bacterium]